MKIISEIKSQPCLAQKAKEDGKKEEAKNIMYSILLNKQDYGEGIKDYWKRIQKEVENLSFEAKVVKR